MLANEHNTAKTYLHIRHGHIVAKKDGKEVYYNVVGGSVTGIILKEEKIDHDNVLRWHIFMQDGDERYDLNFGRSASTFISIVRYLASDNGLAALDNIKIKVYPKMKDYTNVSVWGNERRLDWCREVMPSIRVIHRNGKDIVDNEEQLEWIEALVRRINTRIAHPMSGYGGDDEREGGDAYVGV